MKKEWKKPYVDSYNASRRTLGDAIHCNYCGENFDNKELYEAHLSKIVCDKNLVPVGNECPCAPDYPATNVTEDYMPLS